MALSATMKARLADMNNLPYLCTLVELSNGGVVYYRFATQPFTSSDGNIYEDLIVGELIREGTLEAATSVGDFDIVDPVRSIAWRETDFSRWKCSFFIGDTRLLRTEFEQVAVQWVERVTVINAVQYRIELREVPVNLDTPLWTPQVNGIYAPSISGAVYNIEPVLTNAALLEYCIGVTTSDLIIVRDNGVELTQGTGYNLSTQSGCKIITLVNSPAGQITADVVGSAVTSMHWIVQNRLLDAGIYLSEPELLSRMYGFWSAALKTSFMVGMYVPDPQNMSVQEAITKILSDCGCVMRIDDDGKPSIYYMDWYNCNLITPTASITNDQVIAGSVRQVDSFPSHSKITLKYQANASQQSQFAGSVSAANKDLLSKEYREEYVLANPACSVPGRSEGALVVEAGTVSDSATALIVAYNLCYKHVDTPCHRVWELDTVGLLWLKLGDVVSLDVDEITNSGFSRYFVTGYKHNDSTGVSTLTLTEGTNGG